MTRLTKQQRSALFQSLSEVVKETVTESTEIYSLRHRLDSMTRSEMIFIVEDLLGVDMWGVKVNDFDTIGEFIAEVERRL